MSDLASSYPASAQLTPRRWTFLYFLSLFVALVEIVWLIFYRQVNLDEGWYLGASQLVYEGHLLYRDFAFTQGPLLPYVYGAWMRVAGPSLYAHRALTAALFLVATWLSGRVARRLGGLPTAVFCLLALATSLYAVAHFAYVATYALAGCLLMAAVVLATSPRQPRALLATVCLCLAIGTRLSLAPVLLPFALYLIVARRVPRTIALAAAAVALATLGLLYGPFWLASGEVMLYDLLGFHTDRMKLAWRLTSALKSARSTLIDFAMPIGLSVGAVAIVWRQRPRAPYAETLLLGASALVLFLAHLIPRTSASYYNSLIIPFLSILSGLALARIIEPRSRAEERQGSRLWSASAGVGIASILLALNLFLQARAVIQHGLVAWPPRLEIAPLQEAAAFLRRYTQPGDHILTFNVHLAVEAGRRVLPGFEMSIFAYQPTWPTARAERFRVLNNELLFAALDAHPAAIAVTEYDLELLGGERERFLDVVHSRLRWAKTTSGFGPYRDDLRIYLPPQYDPPTPAVSLLYHLDDGIDLLGFDLEPTPQHGREPVRLALYWRARAVPTAAYTVFTHLVDATGAVVAGWDNPPCRHTCPTTTWRIREVLRDEYMIPLPPTLPAGRYQITAGMYDPSTGERLLARAAAGGAPQDEISLGEIEVK